MPAVRRQPIIECECMLSGVIGQIDAPAGRDTAALLAPKTAGIKKLSRTAGLCMDCACCLESCYWKVNKLEALAQWHEGQPRHYAEDQVAEEAHPLVAADL